jgi:hypothetical protein
VFAATLGAFDVFAFAAMAFEPAAAVESEVAALEFAAFEPEPDGTPLQPLQKAASPAIATTAAKRQEVICPSTIPVR